MGAFSFSLLLIPQGGRKECGVRRVERDLFVVWVLFEGLASAFSWFECGAPALWRLICLMEAHWVFEFLFGGYEERGFNCLRWRNCIGFADSVAIFSRGKLSLSAAIFFPYLDFSVTFFNLALLITRFHGFQNFKLSNFCSLLPSQRSSRLFLCS